MSPYVINKNIHKETRGHFTSLINETIILFINRETRGHLMPFYKIWRFKKVSNYRGTRGHLKRNILKDTKGHLRFIHCR